MIDISIIAKELKLPPEQVQRAIELLDAGGSIPFICRFRRDATGALDEQQVLAIKRRSLSLRALAERKAAICKSIESQDKLSDELKVAIDKATTSREVEDCYLPFKQRKRSRASEARQKGLSPLAEDIFKGTAPEVDLAAKATEYVRVDKGLSSVDEVIAGVNELLADQFANDVELKNQIREIVSSSGKLTSKSTEVAQSKQENAKTETSKPLPAADADKTETPSSDTTPAATNEAAPDDQANAAQEQPVATEDTNSEAKTETKDEGSSTAETPTSPTVEASAETKQDENAAAPSESASTTATPTPAADAAAKPKKKKKKKKKKKAESPFKAYHDFKQPLAKVAHFQTLAINRGERARKLRVSIACNEQKIREIAEKKLVPAEHPFADHLKTCIQDALDRFVLPSIEREIRREMTEAAEKHALDVVSDNLRNLLMQPPMRNRRVLAIHPGYKRGCAVAILETNGELLHSDYVFVVGNQTRRDESKQKIAELVGKYDIDVIAVGNGPASREAERMVSDAIENHLIDNKSIRYLMINEAGVNVYSTSEVARQELPEVSGAVRCAISIGRRFQEPLSEFVKVSPAGIVTGTFQNDVRAKHLAESLDDAMRFSVNRVGVDANTANASLLSYVSGLNPLTAKRLVEYREKNGGFKNREQLKEVNGIGDETFAQAAGFLKVVGGEQPLDSTSIHPENYSLAEKIIQKVDSNVADLFPQEIRKPESPPAAAPATETPVASEKTDSETATTPQQLPSAGASENAPEPNAAAPAKATETPPEPTAENAVEMEPAAEGGATEHPPAAEPAVTDAKSETKQKAAPVDEKPVPPRPDNRPSAELVAARKSRREIVERITALEVDKLAAELSATPALVNDIIRAMKKPNWDPREKRRKPIMRRTMLVVGDVEIGQELEAQVVNVVDFGAFVDIGIGESCLVHVSQLSNRFIRDPQVVFNTGDVIRVWVTEIDSQKRRIKLTAVRPGTDRSRSRGRSENSGRRSDRSERKSGGGKPNSGRKPNRRGDKKKSNFQKSWKPKRAPKPVKPITEDMLAGEKPMTSFSDLLQFVNKKPENKSDK